MNELERFISISRRKRKAPTRCKPLVLHRWAIKWTSTAESLDGARVHFQDVGITGVFTTRRACREHIKVTYGYIAKRPDLRKYPHGWRVPKPVKVTVTYQEVA